MRSPLALAAASASASWSRHRVTIDRPAKPLQFSSSRSVSPTYRHHDSCAQPLPRLPPIDLDLQIERVIREKLLEPSTEEVRLHQPRPGSGKAIQRVAVITSLSLYLFIEDASYFLCEPQLTASEKRSGRRDGNNLLREDEKFRWNTLIEVDFLAGDQSVMALRFKTGSCQLRFGDDFPVALQARAALLPEGIEHWRRNFGFMQSGSGVEEEEGEEGEEEGLGDDAADAQEEELGEDDHQASNDS